MIAFTIANWHPVHGDPSWWVKRHEGHYLSLLLVDGRWWGSIDGIEIVDTRPESGPGEYQVKMLARKMEHMSSQLDPPDEWTRAFHEDEFARLAVPA